MKKGRVFGLFLFFLLVFMNTNESDISCEINKDIFQIYGSKPNKNSTGDRTAMLMPDEVLRDISCPGKV